MKWGFQIAGTAGQRYQWFKLGLDPSQQQAECTLVRDFPDPHAAPPRYKNSPDELVIDYLTALRNHAEQVLKFKLPAGALIGTPIEYVITVPAVWTDAAQAKTRTCAEKAGLGFGPALHIISEPEAAAIFALDAIGTHGMSVGDTFVVCDAGGGTVDLISYKVTAMCPNLQITEAAPGSGSLCGSSFLNRIFAKFLQDRFGDDDDWDDGVLEEVNAIDIHCELPADIRLSRRWSDSKLQYIGRYPLLVFRTDNVEQVKRQFSGIHGEEFQIPGEFMAGGRNPQ